MDRPRDHPRRVELNDEVHARPPEMLAAPASISYLALLRDPDRPADDAAQLAELASRYGRPAPPAGATHYSADFGAFRLKWERHTEFSRYMFIVDDMGAEPFAATALSRVPAEVVSGLPGELIAGCHAVIVPAGQGIADPDELSRTYFAGHSLIGSAIAGGAAFACTDFRIHADGFSRIVINDHQLSPRQAGRHLQRLLEIDTYRTIALLAFPVARGLVPLLGEAERELAAITTSLVDARDADEGALLDRLTRLEAAIESRGAENQFRFSAASAYYDLVKQRIAELREERTLGLQTFGEFIERRLAPAMNTCIAAAARQEALSRRVARATQLLSTRVAVTQARQNQELLGSMDRRADMQLRLQETVEGLSVVAITYYLVGLIGYLLKGFAPLGLPVSPELAMALTIPIVMGVAALGLGRLRRRVAAGRPPASRGR